MTHKLAFSKVLPLKLLIAVKINMPFKGTRVPSGLLRDRRDWGCERINQCAWKGDNKEREAEVTLEPFSLHRMSGEEIGSML